MTRCTRRALFAAAGTVALLASPRKPWADDLQSFREALVPADPPKPPPAIGFDDADGVARTLAAYRGRGVVLNLWATWCMPCVAEMPALDMLARKLAEANIVVLPLSSDRQGPTVVRAFYMSHGIDDLPVLMDPHGDAARALGARGIPTTLIIDRDGRERGRLEGAVNWATDGAAEAIRRLIG